MKAWSALVLVAATVVLATGAGSSADAGAPLAKDPSFEGGGWAMEGSSPTGTQIRFVEDSATTAAGSKRSSSVEPRFVPSGLRRASAIGA